MAPCGGGWECVTGVLLLLAMSPASLVALLVIGGGYIIYKRSKKHDRSER